MAPTSAPSAWIDATCVTRGGATFQVSTMNYGSSKVSIVPPNPTYVALGDSFSSGEGNPPFDEGTDDPTSGDLCHRSQVAWPHVVPTLVRHPMDFGVLLACSGATTDAMTTTTFKTEDPQLQALSDADIKENLITITIGGNDIGFADALTNCVIDNCVKNHVLAGLSTSISSILPLVIPKVLAGAKARFPDAKLVLVGYPNLMNTNAKNANFHCKWLNRDESPTMVKLATQLDNQLHMIASAEGVSYVSLLPALAGHELCTGVSWVRSLTLGGGQNRGHPLQPGQNAMASFVADALKALGY
jgi:lysophospholipase L1-like esterase